MNYVQTDWLYYPETLKKCPGFSFDQINQVCKNFNINALIYECELSSDGKKAEPAGMSWRSSQAEGNTQLDMLMYQGQYMYFRNIKTIFKQFQCLKCKRCFHKHNDFRET